MAEFLTAIPRYRSNTVKTASMAVASRRIMFEMAEQAGVDFDYSPAGILHFYKSQKDFAHARRVTQMLAEGGLKRRELSSQSPPTGCSSALTV